MGSNPLTTTGCLDIIDAVSRNENSGLTVLDLTVILLKLNMASTKKIRVAAAKKVGKLLKICFQATFSSRLFRVLITIFFFVS